MILNYGGYNLCQCFHDTVLRMSAIGRAKSLLKNAAPRPPAFAQFSHFPVGD